LGLVRRFCAATDVSVPKVSRTAKANQPIVTKSLFFILFVSLFPSSGSGLHQQWICREVIRQMTMDWLSKCAYWWVYLQRREAASSEFAITVTKIARIKTKQLPGFGNNDNLYCRSSADFFNFSWGSPAHQAVRLSMA